MKKICILILLCFFCANFIQAENKEDSLRKAFANSKEDTAKFRSGQKLFLHLSKVTVSLKTKIIADSLMAISKRLNQAIYLGIAYGYQGDYYSAIQKHDLAIQNYLSSKSYLEKTTSYIDLADLYSAMGIHYYSVNKINEAVDYFKKQAALLEKHNIIDIERTTNNCNSLGVCAAVMENYSLAKFYFRNSLRMWMEQKDSASMGFAYNNLAEVAMDQGDLDSSNYYYELALKLKLKFTSRDEIADAYFNISVISSELKKSELQLKYLLEAEKNVDSSNYELLCKIYLELSNAYHRKGDDRLAFDYQQKYAKLLKNKIDEIDGSNLNRVEKAYADSLINFNEKEIQKLEIANQNSQIENDKQQKLFLLIGLILVLVGGILFYNRYKVTKKQKSIIEEQHLGLEEKNKEITHQKELIEEKQKEVMDSINYAQRIQNAVLTNESVWQKVSPEHFILFKPKDIVSGDFYWAYNTPNNRSIWAVADCTGHGVPGALMSMLGNSILNQIVVEGKIFKANEILNKLREKIIKVLEQKGVSQNDGMDISLCVWNKLNNTLEFAGANNPIVVARGSTLIELEADKMPIGNYHSDIRPFSSKEFELQLNDVIYMYTDGYADQFGGPKGKKFRYKALDELLLNNAALPVEQQKQIAEETFLTWKGGLIQTDDVCIIGVKVVT